MIELISIICSLAICILTPIEVSRIRSGRVREKFKSDPGKYIAAYHKQLALLTWVGVGFGILSIALSFIEMHPGEGTVKIIAGIIWFAVAGICAVSKRMLPDAAAAGSLTGSGA
jgi:hypothetical protein